MEKYTLQEYANLLQNLRMMKDLFKWEEKKRRISDL